MVEPTASTLVAEQLTIGYRGHPVLRDITLHAGQGSTVLLGRNGAGKTTLLRALAGDLAVMSGSARLQDSTGTAVPLAHVGYLPQDPTLPPGFTAAELVAYAVWLRGGTRSQATGAARRALSIVDLADHADERIGRLSGGMRQRVALAAVLAPRPRALVLDEPTGSLDPMQRDLFATTVARLAEDHVVVVSTHSLDRLALEADQLAILGDGRLVCASPPAGLCAPQPLSLEALTAASLAVLRGHVPDAAA